ncbi:hypothetical protein BGZ83_008254 [Gryganskiella cystojenkinii]|nr:hypothetical protein BGZ83_008254 [Gryganskiella cystojenkinii]
MSPQRPDTFVEQHFLFRRQLYPEFTIHDPLPPMSVQEFERLKPLWIDFIADCVAYPENLQFIEAFTCFVTEQCGTEVCPQPSKERFSRAVHRLEKIWREDVVEHGLCPFAKAISIRAANDLQSCNATFYSMNDSKSAMEAYQSKFCLVDGTEWEKGEHLQDTEQYKESNEEGAESDLESWSSLDGGISECDRAFKCGIDRGKFLFKASSTSSLTDRNGKFNCEAAMSNANRIFCFLPDE